MPSAMPTAPQTRVRPRVLVVDDEPGLVDVVCDLVRGMDCTVTVARTLQQAKRRLGSEQFELMVTDVHLPDGDGLSLLATLQRRQPMASAIVITGNPSVSGAVTALRCGAVDFVAKPFDANQLLGCLRTALDRQAKVARQEQRLVRLRTAVKRLGVARRTVSQKVDLLCNDLIGAYGELAEQVGLVRTEEGFRKHLGDTSDLEQLLCHTMDWLLRELGPSNAALWLAAEDGQFQLGAYMKHTVAGDDAVADAMREAILPATVQDGLLHAPGEELRGKPGDVRVFKGQDVLALSATYLGEPLAAIVFFRDAASAFTDEDVATLKAIAPIFATVLAGVVRDPTAATEEGASPFYDGEESDETERGEPRADDWWKRGERPPF